jgi:hypothetical protein
MQERRAFLKQAFAAGALAGTARAEALGRAEDWPILLFEKPVQALGYDEIGEQLAAMGAGGIEATVRKGGHIDPAEAAKEVPAMLKSLGKSGLQTVIAATGVTGADKATGEFLRVLRDNGISRYRMGHYRYHDKSSPVDQVAGFRDRFRRLAELNEQAGVQGLYQIHSGHAGKGYVGSLLWDVVGMLEGIGPDVLGLAFDLRHVRNDTGNSWKTAAEVARGHIGSLFVKDARWEGERTDQRVNVPLDSGFVTRDIFDYLRERLVPMPLSLHMEWGEHQIYPKESARDAWPLIRRDMEVLRKWRG